MLPLALACMAPTCVAAGDGSDAGAGAVPPVGPNAIACTETGIYGLIRPLVDGDPIYVCDVMVVDNTCGCEGVVDKASGALATIPASVAGLPETQSLVIGCVQSATRAVGMLSWAAYDVIAACKFAGTYSAGSGAPQSIDVDDLEDAE